MALVTAILSPIHLLLYSTLLGTTVYQSFIVVKITYRVLPIHHFTNLQKRLFPAYFRTTALLALGTILTSPSWTTKGSLGFRDGKGLEFGALGMMIVTAGINWAWLGEAVGRIMIERIHQETHDGRKYTELENQSFAMRGLNKRFKTLHAASIHVNLVGMAATVLYGVLLGQKLKW